MKLAKKDMIWSVILLAIPAFALVLGVIPGMAVVRDEADLTQLIYSSLLVPNGWNNAGITASLLMLVMAYLTGLAFVYLRGQSTGILKAAWIFAMVATAIGVITMITETRMLPVPFVAFPVLMAVESVLAYIRLQAEVKRGY